MPAVIGPSAAAAAWAQKFQGSPIVLASGTGSATNGDIPLTTFTDSDPNAPPFAQYMPLPGAAVIRNQVTTFPFANQAVAANAVIQQPVPISIMMTCPVQTSWAQKTTVMNNLIEALKTHINLGGLFNVVTPSRTYTNCILLEVRDVSQGETLQPQYKYQFDFLEVLVTQDQAQAVLNTMLQNLTNQPAPAPALPNVPTALAQVNASGTQLSQSIVTQLGPALAAAGVATGGLTGSVNQSVALAISGNLSPLELANDIAVKFMPATNAVGMPWSAALQLMQSNVTLALKSVGVTPLSMSNLLKASYGSVSIPGISVTRPATLQ